MVLVAGLFEWAYEVKRGSAAVVKSSAWEKRDTYDVELTKIGKRHPSREAV